MRKGEGQRQHKAQESTDVELLWHDLLLLACMLFKHHLMSGRHSTMPAAASMPLAYCYYFCVLSDAGKKLGYVRMLLFTLNAPQDISNALQTFQKVRTTSPAVV